MLEGCGDILLYILFEVRNLRVEGTHIYCEDDSVIGR